MALKGNVSSGAPGRWAEKGGYGFVVYPKPGTTFGVTSAPVTEGQPGELLKKPMADMAQCIAVDSHASSCLGLTTTL